MQVDDRKAHAARIVRYAKSGFRDLPAIPDRIRDSWRRSIDLYGLDPAGQIVAPVLSTEKLREHQACNEALLRISEAYIGTLQRQLAHLSCCLLLADAEGATLEARNCAAGNRDLGRLKLTLGACWSERAVGTGGIGMVLHDHEPTLVHRDEHLSSQIIEMSCSAAPIFDVDDELRGVLNVTNLTGSGDRCDQSLVYGLVVETATMIANAWFLARNQNAWVVEVNNVPGFFAHSSDQLIAFDDSGQIVAGNRAARHGLLCTNGEQAPSVLEDLFQPGAEALINAARIRPGAIQTLTSVYRRVGDVYYGRVRAPSGLTTVQRRVPALRSEASHPANPHGSGLARVASPDPRIETNIWRIRRVMDHGLPILLLGETGTGKEVFARAVHEESEHRDGAFVAVNCAAIPDTLIESELFGYRGGAFTGANSKGERGKILQADKGTLFLDEIGDMPTALQTRLLRVLSEGEVLPLGSTQVERVDINVICATHRDLLALVRQGVFREDLFYRLNAATFHLPPLRERSDRLEIVRRIFAEEAAAVSDGLEPRLTDRALTLADTYPWPGNIRQLRHALRYAVAVADEATVDISHFPSEIVQSSRIAVGDSSLHSFDEMDESTPARSRPRQQFQRDRMIAALRQHDWHVSAAAQALGVARATFYRRMKRYNIVPPNRADANIARGKE